MTDGGKKLLLGLLVLVFAGYAWHASVRVREIKEEARMNAEAAQQSDAWPCGPEAEKWCPGVRPDTSQMDQCLAGHSLELSHACAAHQEEYALRNQWNIACFDENAAFCRGLSGPERVDCLAAHSAQLSVMCSELVARQFTIRKWHSLCKPEAARLCPDVKEGGGRAGLCLRDAGDQVSESCRDLYRDNPRLIYWE